MNWFERLIKRLMAGGQHLAEAKMNARGASKHSRACQPKADAWERKRRARKIARESRRRNRVR